MKGIGASPGIAIGIALVIKKQEMSLTGISMQNTEEVQKEIEKFEHAIRAAVADIEKIKRSISDKDNSHEMLEIQIELLEDEQIKTDTIEKINSEKKNAN